MIYDKEKHDEDAIQVSVTVYQDPGAAGKYAADAVRAILARCELIVDLKVVARYGKASA